MPYTAWYVVSIGHEGFRKLFVMNPVPVELATIVASVVDELVCAHTLLEMKVAVTLFAALMVSVQVDKVPLQAPVHPENANPLAGIAVRVTEAPP